MLLNDKNVKLFWNVSKNYLKGFTLSQAVWCDSWIFYNFSDFLEVCDKFHWQISFTFSADLTEKIGVTCQIFIWKVVFNLKILKVIYCILKFKAFIWGKNIIIFIGEKWRLLIKFCQYRLQRPQCHLMHIEILWRPGCHFRHMKIWERQ